MLTLNRPRVLNAIDWDMLRRLDAALAASSESGEVRCILVEAAGERAFSAGADLKAVGALTAETVPEWIRLGHSICNRLVTHRAPVVAAIRGYALGGGFELALACDVRVVAASARCGLPEVSRGWLPGWGGARRLAALAGPSVAKSVVLLGDRLDAARAVGCGLAHLLVPDGELTTAARDLAGRLAQLQPVAVAEAKAQLLTPGLVATPDVVAEDTRLLIDALAALRASPGGAGERPAPA